MIDMKNRFTIQIGIFVLIFAIVSIGLGIKAFWGQRTAAETQEIVLDTEFRAAVKKEAKPSRGVEFVQWMVTEAAKARATAADEDHSGTEGEEAEEVDDAEDKKEEAITAEEAPEADAAEGNEPAGEPAEQTATETKNWRTVWADLNLTDEEKDRLQQGVMQLIQKWQAMSAEEQQAERARWQDMRSRFEAMSEAEKLEVSQRLRKRFEEWRQSGRIELPELTLD